MAEEKTEVMENTEETKKGFFTKAKDAVVALPSKAKKHAGGIAAGVVGILAAGTAGVVIHQYLADKGVESPLEVVEDALAEGGDAD